MIDTGSSAFWRATLALCLGSFMVFANLYISQPLLPMLAQEFALTEVEAALSFTLATLTLGCSLLCYGPLSDALGRRGIMIVSLFGTLVCTYFLAHATSYSQLIWLRAIQGICLGGLPAIAIAYMGDEFSKPALSAAVGLYISANTLGGIGGRLLGGFIGEWAGWHNAFLTMCLISVVCLGLFVWLLPASKGFQSRHLSPVSMLGDLVFHLKNPLLLIPFLIGGLNFFIFINQYSYATFLLSDAPYNLSASLLGMLFLTYLSGTFGSALAGRWFGHIPKPLVMAGGTSLLLIGSAITLMGSVVWIVAGFLVNALGFFVAHSTASAWVSQTASRARASASSLYLVFYYLGASSGGLYLAPFWQSSGWSGVIVASWLVLALTLALCLVLYRLQRHAESTLANSIERLFLPRKWLFGKSKN